ncbi:DNA polymerase III subunit delta' C-terminal domain-containing protein [Buchnera aphidicola]|nr:DNA polymerase III subunit delta' C-terminal domain-containing protein [Buchnera aphidicola]
MAKKKSMKLYPWLRQTYKNIIYQYKKKTAHHAILIKTQKGLGTSELIWFISKWLLCLKRIDIYFCNQCHGCTLMNAHNHPDWHNFKNEKNEKLQVDDVRKINNKIFKSAQQGGPKIIFLENIKNLTEPAMNAFLKTLEEPPKNTWFLIINYHSLDIFATLHSRCVLYKVFTPTEKDSLQWLNNNQINNDALYLTALRINAGSPISSKKFLDGTLWMERIKFYQHFIKAFKKKDLLELLKILNTTNTHTKINWICSLLLDAIKFHYTQDQYLINLDQLEIIKFLSKNYTNDVLDISIRNWMQCRYRLLNISGINYELLMAEQLLRWETILHF